jgi:hypothetical protein
MQYSGERTYHNGIQELIHLVLAYDHYRPNLADLSTHRGIEVGQVDGVSPGKGGH